MSPEVALAVTVVVIVVAGISFLLLVRRLGKSKGLAQMTRITAERSAVRAQAAEDTAERLAGVAEHAVTVGTAISHAERLARVAESALNIAQMGGQPAAGRHALHALPDPAERHIA